MAKAKLRLVAPTTVNRTVAPRRPRSCRTVRHYKQTQLIASRPMTPTGFVRAISDSGSIEGRKEKPAG
jgi:hypothetical protein